MLLAKPAWSCIAQLNVVNRGVRSTQCARVKNYFGIILIDFVSKGVNLTIKTHYNIIVSDLDVNYDTSCFI